MSWEELGFKNPLLLSTKCLNQLGTMSMKDLSVAVQGAQIEWELKATKQEMEALCQALHRLTLGWKIRASARQRLAFGELLALCLHGPRSHPLGANVRRSLLT